MNASFQRQVSEQDHNWRADYVGDFSTTGKFLLCLLHARGTRKSNLLILVVWLGLRFPSQSLAMVRTIDSIRKYMKTVGTGQRAPRIAASLWAASSPDPGVW